MRGYSRTAAWLTLTVFLATAASTALSLSFGVSRSVWLANALLLAILLETRRKHLPLILLCLTAACIAGAAAGGLHTSQALAVSTVDMAQTLAMYALLRGRYRRASGRIRIRAWRFVTVSLGVCTGAALLDIALSPRPPHGFPAMQVIGWVLGDVVSLQIGMVALVLWRRSALFACFRPEQRRGTLLALGGVAVSAAAVFGQSRYPLLFMIFPFLVFAVFARGMAAGVYSLLLIEAIAVPLTMHGSGPFTLMRGVSLDGRMAGLQAYLVISGATAYPIGRALNARRRMEELYKLLAYNSRDLITRGTLNGIRRYASPSVTELLGWDPSEIINCPAIDIVHPEDRHLVQNMLERLYTTGRPQEVVYRALTRSGPPVWLEGHFRVVLNPNNGQQQEYIATSRDITERVVAEKELTAAYMELERLASLDGLTQVSNRRVFDETLQTEWKRAQRDGSQLSLLMLDVDYFKAYNDSLGHPAGDECLRSVAAALRGSVHRTGDMVARYGGEEFAVLLPATGLEGAEHVARKMATAVSGMGLEHQRSPIGRVTCSIGVATATPLVSSGPQSLVKLADTALYQAKAAGRNRYCIGPAEGAGAAARATEHAHSA